MPASSGGGMEDADTISSNSSVPSWGYKGRGWGGSWIPLISKPLCFFVYGRLFSAMPDRQWPPWEKRTQLIHLLIICMRYMQCWKEKLAKLRWWNEFFIANMILFFTMKSLFCKDRHWYASLFFFFPSLCTHVCLNMLVLLSRWVLWARKSNIFAFVWTYPVDILP